MVIRDIRVLEVILLTYKELKVLRDIRVLEVHLRLRQELKVLKELLVFKDLPLLQLLV